MMKLFVQFLIVFLGLGLSLHSYAEPKVPSQCYGKITDDEDYHSCAFERPCPKVSGKNCLENDLEYFFDKENNSSHSHQKLLIQSCKSHNDCGRDDGRKLGCLTGKSDYFRSPLKEIVMSLDTVTKKRGLSLNLFEKSAGASCQHDRECGDLFCVSGRCSQASYCRLGQLDEQVPAGVDCEHGLEKKSGKCKEPEQDLVQYSRVIQQMAGDNQCRLSLNEELKDKVNDMVLNMRAFELMLSQAHDGKKDNRNYDRFHMIPIFKKLGEDLSKKRDHIDAQFNLKIIDFYKHMSLVKGLDPNSSRKVTFLGEEVDEKTLHRRLADGKDLKRLLVDFERARADYELSLSTLYQQYANERLKPLISDFAKIAPASTNAEFGGKKASDWVRLNRQKSKIIYKMRDKSLKNIKSLLEKSHVDIDYLSSTDIGLKYDIENTKEDTFFLVDPILPHDRSEVVGRRVVNSALWLTGGTFRSHNTKGQRAQKLLGAQAMDWGKKVDDFFLSRASSARQTGNSVRGSHVSRLMIDGELELSIQCMMQLAEDSSHNQSQLPCEKNTEVLNRLKSRLMAHFIAYSYHSHYTYNNNYFPRKPMGKESYPYQNAWGGRTDHIHLAKYPEGSGTRLRYLTHIYNNAVTLSAMYRSIASKRNWIFSDEVLKEQDHQYASQRQQCLMGLLSNQNREFTDQRNSNSGATSGGGANSGRGLGGEGFSTINDDRTRNLHAGEGVAYNPRNQKGPSPETRNGKVDHHERRLAGGRGRSVAGGAGHGSDGQGESAGLLNSARRSGQSSEQENDSLAATASNYRGDQVSGNITANGERPSKESENEQVHIDQDENIYEQFDFLGEKNQEKNETGIINREDISEQDLKAFLAHKQQPSGENIFVTITHAYQKEAYPRILRKTKRSPAGIGHPRQLNNKKSQSIQKVKSKLHSF